MKGLTGAVDLEAGGGFTCAALASKKVKCWGDNQSGSLGNGTRKLSTTPVAVKGLKNVIAIAAGSGTVCATLATKTVECWGDNTRGELGTGVQRDSSKPVLVANFSDAGPAPAIGSTMPLRINVVTAPAFRGAPGLSILTVPIHIRVIDGPHRVRFTGRRRISPSGNTRVGGLVADRSTFDLDGRA